MGKGETIKDGIDGIHIVISTHLNHIYGDKEKREAFEELLVNMMGELFTNKGAMTLSEIYLHKCIEALVGPGGENIGKIEDGITNLFSTALGRYKNTKHKLPTESVLDYIKNSYSLGKRLSLKDISEEFLMKKKQVVGCLQSLKKQGFVNHDAKTRSWSFKGVINYDTVEYAILKLLDKHGRFRKEEVQDYLHTGLRAHSIEGPIEDVREKHNLGCEWVDGGQFNRGLFYFRKGKRPKYLTVDEAIKKEFKGAKEISREKVHEVLNHLFGGQVGVMDLMLEKGYKVIGPNYLKK